MSGIFASAANLMKLANDRFEATNDKRKADSAKWLRELAKMAEKTANMLKAAASTALEAGDDDDSGDSALPKPNAARL